MVVDRFIWDIASWSAAAQADLNSTIERDGKKVGPYRQGIYAIHVRVYDPAAVETSSSNGFNWQSECFPGAVQGSEGVPANLGLAELFDDEPMNQGSYGALYTVHGFPSSPFEELVCRAVNDATPKTDMVAEAIVLRP
jgi:hypothetical protein